MKKAVILTASAVLLLVLVLGRFASNPIVSGRTELPDGYRSAIKHQAKGIYSNRLPLVPIYVSVEECSDEAVYYTIHYFPFGTVGMSYTETDGYNIEKPLTHQ